MSETAAAVERTPRKPRKIATVAISEKLLLTAAEVAGLTGLHQDVVYRWGKSGRFPTLRVNRTVRFPRRAIEAWIERNQQGGE
jgi:excisionase family DNA binding protein